MFNVDTGLTAISQAIDWMKALKSESLIDYTRTCRVEPIALVDADCLLHENMEDIMQSLLSQYAGYYLQAAALSTTVGKIDVKRTLDRLNTDRSPVDSGLDTAGYLLANESFAMRLPKPGDPRAALEAEWVLEADRDIDEAKLHLDQDKFHYQQGKDLNDSIQKGVELGQRMGESQRDYDLRMAQHQHAVGKDAERMVFDAASFDYKAGLDAQTRADKVAEAQRIYDLNVAKFGHDKALSEVEQTMKKEGLSLQRAALQFQREKEAKALTASEIAFGRDTIQTMKELSNLSVGKLFEVQITDGLHKATIPVSIRIRASTLPTSNLVHILSFGNRPMTAKDRYHAWARGDIDFIRDVVLCNDIVDSHRKALFQDKDGVYTSLAHQKSNNTLSAMVSGNPTINAASALAVFSKNTAELLEDKIGGQLKQFRFREKVFQATSLMIMAVLEKDWGRVTFYHRGIDSSTTVAVKSLRGSNKDGGPNVTDILAAYQLGNSPSL